MESAMKGHSTDAAFNVECEILREKLACGINGTEWLIAQKVIDEDTEYSLNDWLKYLNRRQIGDIHSVIRDALLMGPDDFYAQHGFNWWISVDDSLTYLKIAKERNYEWYFNFLKETYSGERSNER